MLEGPEIKVLCQKKQTNKKAYQKVEFFKKCRVSEENSLGQTGLLHTENI